MGIALSQWLGGCVPSRKQQSAANTQRNSRTVATFRSWRGLARICRSSVPAALYHIQRGTLRHSPVDHDP